MHLPWSHPGLIMPIEFSMLVLLNLRLHFIQAGDGECIYTFAVSNVSNAVARFVASIIMLYIITSIIVYNLSPRDLQEFH